MAAKALTVVVTIVDAGEALTRCLEALRRQVDAPELEVIVPYDDSVIEVRECERRFPEFRFLHMGSISTRLPKDSAAGQHELYDRRRAAGLNEATGALVALLEDRGAPRCNWARAIEDLHSQPFGVVGGAIENAGDSLLSWAVYFCDFGRYQLPLEAGPANYVSDINVSYKREALEGARELWRDRYHETSVHWELRRRGEVLFLTPQMVVDHRRSNLRFPAVLRERVAWGRLFAYTRARQISRGRCYVYAGLAPLLPVVLFSRQLASRLRKRNSLVLFMSVSVPICLLLIAWSLGELLGYLTRRA